MLKGTNCTTCQKSTFSKTGLCVDCQLKQPVPEKKKEKNKEIRFLQEIDSIILTTKSGHDLKIKKRIEIITSECVFGMNIF